MIVAKIRGGDQWEGCQIILAQILKHNAENNVELTKKVTRTASWTTKMWSLHNGIMRIQVFIVCIISDWTT